MLSSRHVPLINICLCLCLHLFVCQVQHGCSVAIVTSLRRSPRPPPHLPSMKSWTTVGEFAWLSERAPDWRKLGSNKRRRKEWLESTVASFLKTFAPSGSAREKAPAVS